MVSNGEEMGVMGKWKRVMEGMEDRRGWGKSGLWKG